MNEYMKIAVKLANEALCADEVPVGAVVVERKSGKIIGSGRNRREAENDPTAHAEIVAIREAAAALGTWRLCGCDIYVTLEPCPMCCGAIINARIDRVYFGAYDLKGGCAHSLADLFSLPFCHKPEVYGGISEDECSALLKDFFSEKR